MSTPNVCDSCLLVAYDNGITDSYEAQAVAMVTIGADCEDHICDAVDDPEFCSCDCGCRHP